MQILKKCKKWPRFNIELLKYYLIHSNSIAEELNGKKSLKLVTRNQIFTSFKGIFLHSTYLEGFQNLRNVKILQKYNTFDN